MDFTSWWPRPKAEGVAEELARLQGDAHQQPTAEGDSALPPGVRAGGAFPKADGRGYETAEVDAFMARAGSMSSSEIRSVRFRTARKGGYDRAAVDSALEQLELQARLREPGTA